MTDTKEMTIRLALREEGQFWNAYLARADTMEGSYLLGSILINAAKNDPEIKRAFIEVMKQVLAHGVKNMTGKKPSSWDEGPAPESERSGHA